MRPRIVKNSLELGGVLNLKYYLAVPEDFVGTGAKMTFDIPNREPQEIMYSAAATDPATSYKVFPCKVYAYQMADTITATFTYQKDGETKTMTDEYSVEEYLYSIAEGDYTGDAKTLVNKTWAYGHYIQPYLASVNGWTVGETYAELNYEGPAPNVTAATSGSEAYKLVGSMKDQVQSAQYRLTLNADTNMSLMITLKNSDTVTVWLDDNEVYPVISGNTYRVSVNNIASNNLGVSRHLEMYIGEKIPDNPANRVFDFRVSPMSYVYTVLSGSPSPDEQNALAALYEYYVAAHAYAQAHPSGS